MKANFTPLNRFAEALGPFHFPAREAGASPYAEGLGRVRKGLPPLPADMGAVDSGGVAEPLERRAEHIATEGGAYYRQALSDLAGRALRDEHAFAIVFDNTLLVDALHRCAFATALEELPLLVRGQLLETAAGLANRSEQLPRKQQRLAELEAQLQALEQAGEDSAQLDYYRQIADESRQDLEDTESGSVAAELNLSAVQAFDHDEATFATRLVMFARGGYGRAELSFASDVDSGYCLDTRGLVGGEIGIFQAFILRVERLLADAGLETVHQYFEIEEDLSRFTAPETLHTIPAILESRALSGNAALLAQLQDRFREILPFEAMVQRKLSEYEAQPKPGATEMDLKEDFGGLRTVQVPLWLLGFTHNASSFLTLDLLHLARQKQLLSMWEVMRLLRALELLLELRNFVGGAQQYYYDREALESGFHVQHFQANRLDDALARLYLFRKHRYTSMDELDAARTRMVDEVQRTSKRLLQRVLNRTLNHRLEGFQVSVHLGEKRIIAVHSLETGGSADIKAIFRESHAVLELFAYVARSGYQLSGELCDALSGVVAGFSLPVDEEGRRDLAARLRMLMGGAYAHRALAALFEIDDPLSTELPTLLGRIIPALEPTVYLLRRVERTPVALHTFLVRCVECGQEGLEWLKRRHPDFAHMLDPQDVLALKWSLLLHGLGRLQPREIPGETADRAIEVLHGLGEQDPLLEARVRLLIGHHRELVALSRTATYLDQALARYFEIAGRSVVNAVLLYLCNLGILQASGEEAQGDVAALHRLFDEADKMLGAMQGFPLEEQSLELINLYLDRKKQDLRNETRLALVVRDALAHGMREGVFEPLAAADGAAWERLQTRAEQLEGWQREIVLGNLSRDEQGRLRERLLQALRQALGPAALTALTADRERLLSWFFTAYPNRYLLSSTAQHLAEQLPKFANFEEAQVLVDMVPGQQGGHEGLLIFTRNLHRSHSRVAYALSRQRINIGSGKVNRVDLDGVDSSSVGSSGAGGTTGGHGYCYYFQIANVEPIHHFVPREMELRIAEESPPELAFPERITGVDRHGVRVEFRGNDHKGYRVAAEGGVFQRSAADYHTVRVVMRDQPFLFYKALRAFDLFDVEVRQSLITTVGNQLVDYFYLSPADYQRLEASTFEEVFVSLVTSDILDVAR